jgi:hypothetical protein
MFVRLKRAADIPHALKALHSRCWLHGLGYHMISKSGHWFAHRSGGSQETA